MRNRLRRRAGSVARPWEVITEEGTLVRGVVQVDDAASAVEVLRTKHKVPDDMVEVQGGRVFVAPWLLEKIAPKLAWPAFVSEVYPTDAALEVEREPLNKAARKGVPVKP